MRRSLNDRFTSAFSCPGRNGGVYGPGALRVVNLEGRPHGGAVHSVPFATWTASLRDSGNIFITSAVYISAAQMPCPRCRAAWCMRRREASNTHMTGFGLPTSIQGWFQRPTQREYQPLRSEAALNSEARTELKPHRVEERTRLALFEE